MVKIRLFQVGKRKQRSFRIVVMDSRKKRDGRYIEKLGFTNPFDVNNSFKIDLNRVAEWEKNGAKLTKTVSSLVMKAKKNQESL